MTPNRTITERTIWQRGSSIWFTLIFLSFSANTQDILASDDFESGLKQWTPLHVENATVRKETGTHNNVLELSPTGRFPPENERGYSHVLLNESMSFDNVRMEGRFLFPTFGDGYIGFIYNYQVADTRTDFGVIYVKSNGSYVRVSPHYDGNPSWRLYEEMKVSLVDERRIRIGRWHQFRLDIQGKRAQLFLDNLEVPVVSFDQFDNRFGAVGLEARPGRGEPVWVDDIRISQLPPADSNELQRKADSSPLFGWQAQGPMTTIEDEWAIHPRLPADQWRDVGPDPRGALITGLLTQSVSGKARFVYIRARFDAGEVPQPGWLSISAADRLDIWVNGYYRGTVAPDQYIWSDHATSDRHPGARLPIMPLAGVNEVLIRVHGNRFAGGGFFANVQFASSELSVQMTE